MLPPNSAVPLRAEGWSSLIACIRLHISWEQSELLAGDSSKDAGGGGREGDRRPTGVGRRPEGRTEMHVATEGEASASPGGLGGLGRPQPGFLGMHIPGKPMEAESPWWCP